MKRTLSARDAVDATNLEVMDAPILPESASSLQAPAPVAIMDTSVGQELGRSNSLEQQAISGTLNPNSESARPSGMPSDDENSTIMATSPLARMKMEPEIDVAKPTSGVQLSQQIASSLASPPESTDMYAVNTPPAGKLISGMTPPATASSSCHSSHSVQHTQQDTPEFGSTRRASTISIDEAGMRASGSPALSMSSARRGSNRGRGSTVEADEESLRLIKELTAQDRGLRRRAKASI